MWTLWQDLRHSARLLRRQPGFTLTAVGVLTLGIGVNAGVFGLINGLMILVGRLEPGVTREEANAQLAVIAAAHERAHPDDNRNQDLIVGTLDRLDISTRPQDDTQVWVPMGILQGLAATVLLTSSMNLANMMLAFGSARQKEIAIRLAVGGTRSRIVRQLLVQGLMLSLAGGALGLWTATWAAQVLVSSMATVFPVFLALDLTPDATVLFATMMFCAFATVAFGLWPALRLSRPDLLSSLKDHAGEIGGRIAGRITVRGALVTAQLALSLALLVVSGLFVRGAGAGASANPGFDLGPLAIAQIEPTLGGYDAARGREARRALLEKRRSTPGIESVAEASLLPFGDYSSGAAVQREGPRLKNDDPEAAGRLLRVQAYTVTSDYFRTLGLPMVRGREFTPAEEAAVGGTTPVIVDVGLAERLFANEDPVGQLLQYGADSGAADSKPMVIVGLAPAVKHDLFEPRPAAHLYLPSGAGDSPRMFVYARAAAPRTGDAIVTSVRERLRAADAGLPVMFVKSYRSHHEGSARVWILRAAARMFLTLGLAGTFVAVIGLYGVRSYLVSRRTREFGVRMAIGASPADVLNLVVRETLATTAVGLAIGLGLALLLGWGLRAAIYQISPFDPATLGTATGILAIASLAASIIPARRAAHVLPMTALRND